MTFSAGVGAYRVLVTVLWFLTLLVTVLVRWLTASLWCLSAVPLAIWITAWYLPRLTRSLQGRLTDSVLVVRYGVWWRRETTVPMNGMRTFEVWTTPLQRVYHCRTVLLRFAGGRVTLPLLDEETARQIAARLEEN